MARAFICIARNDIPVASLQTLGLLPYTSQRSLIYDPAGQTGYLSALAQNDTVVTTGATQVVAVDTFGLATYLMDRVENVGGGNLALTDAEANQIAGLILTAVAGGDPLTLVAINVMINTPAGVGGSDLDGTASASTGTVDDVLRIANGEVYKVAAATALALAANAYQVAVVGFFAEAANLVEDLLHPGGRGGQEPINTRMATQTPPEDPGFRDILRVEDTSDMHRSALDGRLALMADASYVFANPDFTYGAAGTALTVGGTNIGTDHAGRSVTVYKADGTVLI